MDFLECETDYCPETFVTCHVDGFEEVSIKDEEAIGMKDEIPEATSFPPIETEHEVSLCGACEVVAAHSFRPFIVPTRKL